MLTTERNRLFDTATEQGNSLAFTAQPANEPLK